MSLPLRRTELFELDFVDAATEAEIAQLLQSPDESGYRSKFSLPLVVTPNVDQLVALKIHGDIIKRKYRAPAPATIPATTTPTSVSPPVAQVSR